MIARHRVTIDFAAMLRFRSAFMNGGCITCTRHPDEIPVLKAILEC